MSVGPQEQAVEGQWQYTAPNGEVRGAVQKNLTFLGKTHIKKKFF